MSTSASNSNSLALANPYESDDMKKVMKALNKSPRTPKNWLARGQIYFDNGYPELSYGDVVRAKMLIEDRKKSNRKDLGKLDMAIIQKVENLEADSLFEMVKSPGTPKPIRWNAKNRTKFLKSVKASSYDKNNSKVVYGRRKYSWIDQKYFTRSSTLLDDIREDFRPLGLTLRQSGLSNDSEFQGVFATRNFQKDELLLEELTVSVQADKPRSKRKGYDSSQSYLTECVLDYSTTQEVHPLGVPQISALIGSYHALTFVYFNPFETIAQTYKHLSELRGGDIYSENARSRYDTEYLLTMDNRLNNNNWEYHLGAKILLGIAPLYSFMNHSCDPNVGWTVNTPRGTKTPSMRLSAAKDIKKGDELFISYIKLRADTGLKLPFSLARRREELQPWFGADCRCSKCEDEEAQLEAMKDYPEDSPSPVAESTPAAPSKEPTKKRKRGQETSGQGKSQATRSTSRVVKKPKVS